ncbi:alpha/beta hydrolase [Nocardioides sp. Kera G14]|uniref:alpha/beta hydrolase n=1 Tax=Nocardioides sp. Kera G14 TaxID=2884264 RepID=UPI001D1223C0|nr:alpha/beta hydrolase [Nocardioides sp. Kera G14]UDY22316.1 alpha/beta hydrolase [Nocardioides sp. Kera G14]
MSIGSGAVRTAGQMARNAWAVSWFGDGVEEHDGVPTQVLYDEPHARVEHVAPEAPASGNPVLLVTPLAVPVSCWDLRPGQSLAAHLSGLDGSGEGRPTYTIDYGEIRFRDRGMGFEDWVDAILPTAIQRISDAHGGRSVHLVGWSHGGTMSLLTAAHLPELPIASISALGTPTDYRLNPAYAPVFWVHDHGPAFVVAPVAVLGGTTAPATRLGYRWMAPVREITKPWTLLRNLHQPEVLARVNAVDQFIDAMPGYPGRFFNQAITRLVCASELATGTVHLRDDVVVSMDRLTAPLLLIGSTTDILANAASVAAGRDAYRRADVEFVEVRGLSHLGLIASPRAKNETWPAVDRHLAAHDSA